MTDIDKKREGIREGLYAIIEDRVMNKVLHTGAQIDELIAEMQTFESALDVVIKVGDTSWDDINEVAPLIKEK